MIETLTYLIESGNISAIKSIIPTINNNDHNIIFVTNPSIYAFICKHYNVIPLKKFQPLLQFIPSLKFNLKPLIQIQLLKPSSHIKNILSKFLKKEPQPIANPYLLIQQSDFTKPRDNRLPLFLNPYFYHTVDQNIHSSYLAYKALDAALKAGPTGSIQINLPQQYIFKTNDTLHSTIEFAKSILTKNQEFTLKNQPQLISTTFTRILKQVAEWSFKHTSQVYPDPLQLVITSLQGEIVDSSFLATISVHKFCCITVAVLIEIQAELKLEVWRYLLMILSFDKVPIELQGYVLMLFRLCLGSKETDGYLYRLEKQIFV
ncbi:hypothetical protein SS50377_21241 [Spironucleus salmonicida]|uniref:Uncharacterized protein n=1 Tax=Spironucleus salmonicida TaxID=348837 RepID=V6LI67_9EUKA|nr:hypothetical protein SS50377_21241 [Spironucleus salmonicida]|eukprot:EST44013.1 Hypothetical protein SS50377_16322 [Spironucleus salmonicida]